MLGPYCTRALVLLLALPAAAQAAAAQPPPPAETSAGYTVFFQGNLVGREDVTVKRDPDGTVTITSQSRQSGAAHVTVYRAETRYGPDGSAESISMDGRVNDTDVAFKTLIANGQARTEGRQGNESISKSDPVSPSAIVLPNFSFAVFGMFDAFGSRLAAATPGTELRVYVAPQAEIAARVGQITTGRMQAGTSAFSVRRYEILLASTAGELPVHVSVDEQGHLVRVSVPSQAIDFVREDLSSPTARTEVYSHRGDEPVMIAASGFSLGATMTRPTTADAGARLPAVILLGGSNAADRDGFTSDVPTIGQLAAALADAGFVTVRYDKRGQGQSGGRAESATIADHAEDARAVYRWLRERRDIDRNRIAVLGHAEGAWVALLAASRERRIAAVVAIAAASTTGSEMVLEQQRYALEQANTPEADRAAKIDLQTRINAAVISGQGWADVPPGIRPQADTPWFQSLLMFDPAKVVDDVRQPILLVHGELDREVPVSHLDRLTTLAREGRSRSVEVVTVRGVNHLLVPAVTGHTDEYPSLQDRNVSKDLTDAVSAWMTKTFQGIRN